MPDRPPEPAPADLADPAPAITAAHGRPSRPPTRRPVRRVSASGGEPSPVHAGPPVLIDAPMTADPPIPATSWDVADAPAAAGQPAGSPEPAESPVRALLPTADPAGPPTADRAPTGADPTDMTGGPLTDPFAILDPIPAAQAEVPRWLPPSQDVTPAPVVNVTIGRVEVRPPPAPPPPPPVPATGPQPLSLYEYLERRNGGPS
jgi:hypothetical protein